MRCLYYTYMIVKPLYFYFKWVLDRLAAVVLFVILFPIIFLTFCAIRLSMGSPVFFTQPRGGYQNKVFNVIKFRTMTNQKDANGVLLSDNERLTKIGRFVRKYSLDELPQMINIIKADMSFIGPRPFIAKYLPLYTEEQKRRHSVLPGISGWAQVNGRNHVSWEDRFKYDLYYVDNMSVWLDIRIFFMTISSILLKKGVNQSESVPMEEFRGRHNG